MDAPPPCLAAQLMLAIRHEIDYDDVIDCEDNYESFLINTRSATPRHSDLEVIIGLGKSGIDMNALLVNPSETEMADLARDGNFRLEISHPEYGPPFVIVSVIDPHRLPSYESDLWKTLGPMPQAAWLVHQAESGRVFTCGLLRTTTNVTDKE